MKRFLVWLLTVTIVAAACGDTVAEEVAAVNETTNPSAAPEPAGGAADQAADTTPSTDAPDTTGPGTAPAPATTSASEPIVVPTSEPKPPVTTSPPDPPPTGPASGMIDTARADLAQRLNIAIGDIGVLSVEEVTWRDGSLGCPQPGFSYTQALRNGTQIVLSANGVSYHYHSGGGDPFYCANPQEPLPPGGGDYGDV